MIRLTDNQLSIITLAAEPLHPGDRGPFLQRVATLLNGHELGDGVISRAARQAHIRNSWRAPELEPKRVQSRWGRDAPLSTGPRSGPVGNLPRTCPGPFSGQVPLSQISISSAKPENQNNSGRPIRLACRPVAG
jgi:hypothetical protein